MNLNLLKVCSHSLLLSIYISMSALAEFIGTPTNLGWQVLWAIVAVLVAELIRDIYHAIEHYWPPLMAGHSLHHKVYRQDLSVTSLKAYCDAQWHNDVPEATIMLVLMAAIALIPPLTFGVSYTASYGLWFGCLYSLGFLVTAIARSNGQMLFTDLTHKPGDLVGLPSSWFVNRTYHWRHHFDQGNAYFCSTFTFVDKALGTCLSLKGKTVAVTGASGSLGRALLAQLHAQGAKVVALTSSTGAEFDPALENLQVWTWRLGAETDLADRLKNVDILIINHGVNVHGDRDPEAIQKSYEVNAFSSWRWMELFFATVTKSKHKALKEVWINTSEAEVSPAFSPLYELSKRTIGDLVTLRRLDAPCIVRKLILGPFKSNLNPIGVMSPNFVAWAIVALAKRDFRNIIVSIIPLTYITFPIKELFKSLYFRLFSRSRPNSTITNQPSNSESTKTAIK